MRAVGGDLERVDQERDPVGAPGSSADRAGGASRVVAAWAAGGLLAFQLAWLLVMPPATGIDEFDHVYRASSVSLGHWRPGTYEIPSEFARGAMLPVRGDIVESSGPACAKLRYTKPFNCRPYRDLGDGVVDVATGVDYYNPVYYAVVGIIGRPFIGNASIDVMRLASIVGCAAMFALGVYLTTMWARTRWPLILMLGACLPTTVYSASIATPNGAQMVSGILVWAAAVAMLRVGEPERRPAYVGLMAGAAVMANTHTLGLFWLALIAITMAVFAGPVTTMRLLRPRRRTETVALGLAVAAVAFQLWWLAYARPNLSRPEGGLPGNPWGQIVEGVIAWPLQAIAAFPFRNESAPSVVYGIAAVLVIALTVFTVKALRSRRRLALALGIVVVLTAVVPITITYSEFHRYGMTWQGRYGMPYTVGAFVLAALALDTRGPRLRGPFLWASLAGWGAAETLGITGVLRRQADDHALVAATHWWAPPTVLVVALGVLATVMWFRSVQLVEASSRPAAGEPAEPRRDAVPGSP